MPMSDEERRQLLEIERQLVQEQPRLGKLARQLSAASVYTALRRLAVLAATGGTLGLILLVVGAVLHNVLFAVGVGVLAGTQVVVGAAAIIVEVRAYRREQRTDLSRHPDSPTRDLAAPSV
jgi:Protein of unknown function (DUF3040)